MKTLTIILLLLIVSGGVMAQSKLYGDTSRITATSGHIYLGNEFNKIDTVQVLAYCLIDFDKAVFKWQKLYAVYGTMKPYLSLDDNFKRFQEYLTLDKKKYTGKVIIAIQK